ncbi:polysaccharide export protein [Sphingobium sp. AS12]|nr:polysaccharide export protein [Sphingobium sp. AS12]
MGIKQMLRAFSLALMALASACTSQMPLQSAGQGDVPIYRIGPDDKVRLTVYNEPALSGEEYVVGSDGNASLPLIGNIKLEGMTAAEAQTEVTKAYANGLINNPRVNMEITKFRPFYILGEVEEPGQYEFKHGMTVLNAVAMAGGFTYRASHKHLYIRRVGSGSEIDVPLAADTRVYPGDTIRIIERFF